MPTKTTAQQASERFIKTMFDAARKARPTDFEAFNSPWVDVSGEPGVGITIHAKVDTWLSWDETVALHAWLCRLMEAATDV